MTWRPFPGFQENFCSRGEYEVLAGGSAGPGKTDCLIAMMARDIDVPNYRGLILRRTVPRYLEILDRTQQLYPQFGGIFEAKWHRWKFPSGAMLRLGHMQHEQDKFNYHGGEYQRIGLDELTEFLRSQYMYLFSRQRSARDPRLRSQMISTTNPGGIGHVWVKERFLDVATPGRPYIDPSTGLSRVFIPGLVQDNLYLMKNDPGYVSRLAAMDEIDRQRYLYGNWDIFSGQYFPELSRAVHGCEPFEVPPEWERFMVLDWGYGKPFSIGWYAIDYDGIMYRYREWYGCKEGERDVGLKMIAGDVAEGILQLEGEENIRRRIADPSIFHRLAKPRSNEARGPSILSDFQAAGINFLKADNNRELGWQQVHKRLALDDDIDTDTGEVLSETPRFQVFHTCHAFWRTIPELYEDNRNVEDVDTDQEDHVADEFRYACMWRPIRPKKVERAPEGSFKRERDRLLRARRLARSHGISVQAAYQRVR